MDCKVSQVTGLYAHIHVADYPSYLLLLLFNRCGPMTKYWCMHFEAKNSRFKHTASTIKNFKNIAKSLASRHQSWSCYVNAAHTQNDLTTGPGIVTMSFVLYKNRWWYVTHCMS